MCLFAGKWLVLLLLWCTPSRYLRVSFDYIFSCQVVCWSTMLALCIGFLEKPLVVFYHTSHFVFLLLFKKKKVAGVNKHWVMLNTVLCKSLQSCVSLWPGMQGVGAVPRSCMWGDPEICIHSCLLQLERPFFCCPRLGTFQWSLPAILKLFTLLVTLFLKCLFVFTLLLNQITFSRFNCCLISFIFNSVHILPLLLFQSESHSFLLWLCGRLLLTPINSAVEWKPGHLHSFGRAMSFLNPLQSYK